MATGDSELVEHAWLDSFLDAQTTTIASGTRPTRTTTTTTTDEYSSVLDCVDSQHHHHHHQHHEQQQQQQPRQQPQRVKSEHSYSLHDNGVDFSIKIEPEEHGTCSSLGIIRRELMGGGQKRGAEGGEIKSRRGRLRGEGNCEGVSPPQPIRGSGEHRKLPRLFWCILSFKKPMC